MVQDTQSLVKSLVKLQIAAREVIEAVDNLKGATMPYEEAKELVIAVDLLRMALAGNPRV